MLGAVSLGMSVAGSLFGGRARRKAERKTAKVSAQARAAASKDAARTRERATAVAKNVKANSKAIASDLAKSGAANLADADRREARAREVALLDEASQFTRLRAAADAGGFNPLTLIQAGFTGTALPTGFLSGDSALSASNGIAMSSASIRADGVARATQYSMDGIAAGLSASESTFGQIMGGHEAALTAGQTAYDRTKGAFDTIASGLTGFAQLRNEGQRIQLDRQSITNQQRQFDQSFGLQRDQFDWQRTYDTRQLAAYSSYVADRGPGYGTSRVGGTSGPSLTFGRVSVPGLPAGDSTPQEVGDSVGSPWSEVLTGVGNWDRGLNGVADMVADRFAHYGDVRSIESRLWDWASPWLRPDAPDLDLSDRYGPVPNRNSGPRGQSSGQEGITPWAAW